jgi:TetR/AcrR family transcriptional regulator, mexJK operon transcriptional repressor
VKETRVPGKPKNARKRPGRPTLEDAALVDERVLEAAVNVFLEAGYARAKMDEIASRAGITKQTVYARFPSKDALFSALASHFSALAFRPLHVTADAKQSPKAYLIQFATEVTSVLRDPKSQRLFVVLAAEARAFPDLASQTWVEGAGRLRTHLRGFFDDQIALRRMAISNLDFAVEQFLGLLVGPIFGRLLFERPSYFESEEHAATYIEAAVDFFLANYLVQKQGPAKPFFLEESNTDHRPR